MPNDGSYSPLQPTDVIVARTLKQANYTTALIGKWGLGDVNSTGDPINQGFDYFYGIDAQVACGNWYPPHILRNQERIEVAENVGATFGKCGIELQNCRWANELFLDEAERYIAEKKDVPFFMYFSSTTPHGGTMNGHPGVSESTRCRGAWEWVCSRTT